MPQGKEAEGFQEGVSEQEAPGQEAQAVLSLLGLPLLLLFFKIYPPQKNDNNKIKFTQILEITNPMLGGGILQFVFLHLFLHSQ